MKVVILYSTCKRFDTILNKKVNFGIWNFMVLQSEITDIKKILLVLFTIIWIRNIMNKLASLTSQDFYYQSSKYFGTGKKALERMQKIEFLRIYEEAVLVKRFILGWSFLAPLEGQRGPEYYGNAGYGVSLPLCVQRDMT